MWRFFHSRSDYIISCLCWRSGPARVGFVLCSACPARSGMTEGDELVYELLHLLHLSLAEYRDLVPAGYHFVDYGGRLCKPLRFRVDKPCVDGAGQEEDDGGGEEGVKV